jgi:DNA-binding CsgD family transcriptional regulator/tetratricopeptide (TPR) repeat protein
VEALRWAAVLGPEFSVTELSVVTGRPAGELMGVMGTAIAAAVLGDAGARLGFRHAVIRQVLCEGLAPGMLAVLHLEAARALGAASAAPERVAAQLAAMPDGEGPMTVAGPGREWAAGWLAVNASALVYRAPRAAAELLQEVLAWLPAKDERRVSLQACLVRACFLLSRNDEAEQAAAELLAATPDEDLAGEMAWLVGYAQLRAGRAAEAKSTVAAALARPGLRDLRGARLEAMRAVSLVEVRELAEADHAGQAALERARKAGDGFGAGYALHAMSLAAMHHRDDVAALALIEQALAAIGDDPQASNLGVSLLTNKASCLESLDRFGEATTSARQAVVLAERTGIRLAAARFSLADLYFYAGQWDDALAEIEPAAAIPGQDYLRLMVHGLIALVAVHREDRQAALASLSGLPGQPLRAAAAADITNANLVVLARALIAEQDDGPAAGAAVLAPCLEPGIGAQMLGRFALLPTLTRLAVAAGDAALAVAAANAAAGEAKVAAEAGTPSAQKNALAGHCRGLVSREPRPIQSAADYLAATGRLVMEAEAREDAAALLASCGDAAAAGKALSRACRTYADLGASWDLRRATERLRQFGIRPQRGVSRTRPKTGWAALTPTEVRVAELVARGRSNPEIAAELFLSRNTVQTHVSHILGKLGARSRAEVARAALLQSASR